MRYSVVARHGQVNEQRDRATVNEALEAIQQMLDDGASQVTLYVDDTVYSAQPREAEAANIGSAA